MRLLLATDWADWEQAGFENAVEAFPATHVDVIRDHSHVSRRAGRYVAGVLAAARVIARMPNYDAALAWQQVVGMAVAVLAPSSRLRRCPLTIMGFIWSDSGSAAVRKTRRLATARGLRRAAAIVCYSSAEAERLCSAFPAVAAKVHYCRLGFDVPPQLEVREAPERRVIVSAGASNRDYSALWAAAAAVPATILVFAQPQTIQTAIPAPANLHVEQEFDWPRFFAAMAGARAVVIPIDDPHKTAGQLVALQAMHLGRAIVATDCDGLRDYLRDGVTAILVPAHDAGRLSEALTMVVTDDGLAERLGDAARREAEELLTAGAFWSRVLGIVQATCKDAASGAHRTFADRGRDRGC